MKHQQMKHQQIEPSKAYEMKHEPYLTFKLQSQSNLGVTATRTKEEYFFAHLLLRY